MKLVSFAVAKYRSISWTEKLPIGDLTVLVGPNNEGKSNILKALATALQIVSTGQRWRPRSRRARALAGVWVTDYDWTRDFPSELQESELNGKSRFELEFQLTGTEKPAFNAATGSWLESSLKVKIEIGREHTASFDVRIQGPAKKRLASKQEEIAKFLSNTLDFCFIQTVRQADWSTSIISDLIDRELGVLNENADYKRLQEQVRDLQRPILQKVGDGVRATLRGFIPEVREVHVALGEELGIGRPVHRASSILVDDGHQTDLGQKGDGMQSLAAIALIHHTSQSKAAGKGLILAVEEPESHLHPDAIHRLRSVLSEISKQHQVVVTTHSPILVNRQKLDNNIIVRESQAVPAGNLKDIREALGVKMSDNLIAANLVLLVEGEEDLSLVKCLLQTSSKRLKEALENGMLAIDSMGGASNLSFEAMRYKRLICEIHAFLDDDQGARTAVARAQQDGSIDLNEVNVATCPGFNESEIEDMIDPAVYVEKVRLAAGLELDVPEFHQTNKKWSDRIRAILKTQGKPHGDHEISMIKAVTHAACALVGSDGLNAHLRNSFDSLRKSLETRLGIGDG